MYCSCPLVLVGEGTAIRPEFSRGSFDADLGRWMVEHENGWKSRWEGGGESWVRAEVAGWRDGKGRIQVV